MDIVILGDFEEAEYLAGGRWGPERGPLWGHARLIITAGLKETYAYNSILISSFATNALGKILRAIP